MLIDLSLPDMTGYELPQSLKGSSELSSTRFLAVTGCDDYQLDERLVQEGFELCIRKPVDYEELNRAVRS
jgi:CheY-like chemotaxis protein